MKGVIVYILYFGFMAEELDPETEKPVPCMLLDLEERIRKVAYTEELAGDIIMRDGDT